MHRGQRTKTKTSRQIDVDYTLAQTVGMAMARLPPLVNFLSLLVFSLALPHRQRQPYKPVHLHRPTARRHPFRSNRPRR
jgi:hypothetical protein